MTKPEALQTEQNRHWLEIAKPYLATLGVVAVCSSLGWGASLLGLTSANIVMVFLAGVALVAARLGHWPSVVAAVLSVLIFDYFFVPPVLSFAPTDAQYFVDMAVMLGVGLLISELTARLQMQLRTTQRQERSTGQLYRMSRQLTESAGIDFLISTAGRQLSDIFSGEVVVFLTDDAGRLNCKFGTDEEALHQASNVAAANWAAEHSKIAGLGVEQFVDASAVFAPMVGSNRTLGVLGVRPTGSVLFDDPEQTRLLATCANILALSLERDHSTLVAQEAQVQVQTEQFRNYVLSSASHDLRSPLAMIAVTASSLFDEPSTDSWDVKRGRLRIVADEAHRLLRQVENLLRYARVASGPIVLNRQWYALDDLVGIVLTRLQNQLGERNVEVRLDKDFPLLWIEGQLLEQVLVNLVENAIYYTPVGSDIEIFAQYSPDEIEIHVADKGPGLPPGNESKVFEKFYRGTNDSKGHSGTGLGLAISKAVINAHGGKIFAINRSVGGAEFIIRLACPQRNPAAILEEASLLETS